MDTFTELRQLADDPAELRDNATAALVCQEKGPPGRFDEPGAKDSAKMRPLAVTAGVILTALILGCGNDNGNTPSTTADGASSLSSGGPAVTILIEADTSSL